MYQDNEQKLQKVIMPQDQEAEESILGCMLLDEEALAISVELLVSDDFYQPNYRIVFNAMKELHRENTPVDNITIRNKLLTLNQFDQVGGNDFIANLLTVVYTATNIRHYIEIIQKKAVLRKLILMSNDISKMSYDTTTEDADDIIEFAEKSIFNIQQNRHYDGFHHIKDILVESLERIEKIYENKGKITGVPTGFIDFDTKTAGLQKSDLILIAARPSMGKTAFALNIVQNAAIRHNVQVAFFSLEMSEGQLATRMLCSEAMVDAQKVRTGDMSEQDWDDIIEGVSPLIHSNVLIDDTPSISPMDIRAKCRKLKVEKGIGLIVIDYLQLMSANTKSGSRQQEISEISRSLKAIAREMDAPIIALSQLSRACEQRADHRPMLSDLRESGAIEQDADVVAFLYRDEYYFPETEKQNMAELIIAKQRNGPTGTVELAWLGQYTKFGNYAR